jgi:L-asparaginase II
MNHAPLLELIRGRIVESIHYGSIAVVDADGRLLTSHGDPQTVAFLRSSAKPFQALPFVERGGVEFYGYTPRELALSCASHESAAIHLEAVAALQKKIGIEETNLQCGGHMPGDVDMFRKFVISGEAPSANYNNCSGKHTTMLAHAKMRGLPLENYLEISHPIQQDILNTLAEMCGYEREKIELGVDGCSAPNFALPLYNAALGMARLCDPRSLPEPRAAACRKITSAMTSHSEMVSGYGEFDCEVMKIGAGRIVTKRGAEGYQIMGILPGVLSPDSPGVGVAIKVSDGDLGQRKDDLTESSRVRSTIALEVLRQLGALSPEQVQALSKFGPVRTLKNHRGIVTGQARPAFTLHLNG